MNRTMKRRTSFLMVGALVLGMTMPDADAAVKWTLNRKNVTLEVGSKTVLKAKKNKKPVTWSVKSGKKVISLSKKKKSSVTITGKRAGKAVVQAKLGKRRLTCKVSVTKKKAESTPVDTTAPTVAATPIQTPVATPIVTPVATPSATAPATPIQTPVATPVATPSATPIATPTVTPVPTPIPDPFVYEGLDVEWMNTNLDPQKPMVAFTFDDGPGQNGMAIQELLKEAGAHATFFYIGQNMDSDSGREEVQQAVRNGFEVGNHSYGYGNLDTRDEEAIEEFVGETNAILQEITGFSSFLFRAPSLAISQTMRDCIQSPFINCAVDSKDWNSATAEQITANVTAAKDGDIVLMHVNQKATLEALPAILSYYAENGIQIVSVSELYAMRGVSLYPGHLYSNCPPASN